MWRAALLIVRDSIRETIPDVMKSRRSQDLRFRERSTPCGAAIAANASRRAPKISPGFAEGRAVAAEAPIKVVFRLED
jgi:hypothetical protein